MSGAYLHSSVLPVTCYGVTLRVRIFLSFHLISVTVKYIGPNPYVARIREERGVYRVLVGKPEGKSPLGRLRRRWENNIRMDLQKVGCGVWTGLNWLRIETGGGQL
jgi:hypothetical protein